MQQLPERPATVEAAYEALVKFFPPSFVRWKVRNYKDPAGRVQLMPYIDARAVQDRLDAVFGPDGWSDEYRELTGGVIECTITATFPNGKEVRRADVGSRTSGLADPDDNVKSGYSDALKRAAVKLGVGRYLYRMGTCEGTWDGKRITQVPVMPAAYLPPEYRPAGANLAAECVTAVTRLVGRMRGERLPTPAAWIADRLKDCGLAPDTAVANVQARIVRAIVRKAGEELTRLDDSEPLPDKFPQDGPSLKIRLAQHDAVLAREGRIKAGDLLDEIIRQGTKVGFPAEIGDWNRRSQIRLAVGWATSLTESLSDKPTTGGANRSNPKPEPAVAG